MKQRFFVKRLTIVLFSILSIHLYGQQTEVDVNVMANYNHAIKLYNSKAYAAAQQVFETVAEQSKDRMRLREDAIYYDAMCAIRLNQTDADQKVLDFVANNPTSSKKDKAFFTVANYYFDNRRAAHSLKWYSKVNRDALTQEQKNELDFNMGYALLSTRNLDLAKPRFFKLLDNPKYGNDSRYYYGYISYKQEDYDVAQKALTEVAKNGVYKNDVTYYLLDINFKAGRFEECIKVGKDLLEEAKPNKKSDISKIIGESYFNLKKYKEAIPYLRVYKGKNGKWNNTDYYQLGYAYYKQNDFENAVRHFNRIIGEKNNVSQNAYYTLGECYIYLDKKSEALNAFKSASEMDFDAKIKEDAALNYAKLSYEEGNPYKSVAEVLQDFLAAYPNSPHYQEINGLVVSSYLYQQDFEGALSYLKENKSAENTALSYEVSYYRGIQLFGKNQLTDALPFFKQGQLSTDNSIQAKSLYWYAETHYRLNNFEPALTNFITFKNKSNSSSVEEYSQIDYNIGYSYFKLKKYEEAAQSFQQFLATNPDDVTMKDDAMIRNGDSYFAIKNYSNAIEAYKNVANNSGTGADYATYQIAMSYGFLNQTEQKIQQLNTLLNQYQNSNLLDDALFELANTYAIKKDNKNAHLAYSNLFTNHPKSIYNPKALLRNGLLYYNDGENKKALTAYKEIVAKYPNSNEAKQAVANARNVYVDLGAVDVYAEWVKGISFVNVTNADLDNTTYESAEKQFLNNETTRAIEGFSNYLKNFPTGLHQLQANFYLAQLRYKTNQQEKAIPNYQYVVDQTQSEFSEEALNKLSQIYLQKEDWSAAIPLLERLELEANFKQNILYAQSNLMKGYYQDKKYTKAVTYAEKVLNADKIDAKVEYDAKIILARSAFAKEDYATAEKYFTEIEQNASGELKAEALYYSAFFKNKNKQYAASNKVVQLITSDFSAYKYWGAKSFIVMAKNYYALENSDPYQATYILENIIKNFTQFTDIVTEAKAELKKIKLNEAKTNNSITTPKN